MKRVRKINYEPPTVLLFPLYHKSVICGSAEVEDLTIDEEYSDLS